MNSPFCGKFKITQQYKPGIHDGLDLVGIDSKDIHATISGTVQYAGWENPSNHNQGFGLYVCIRGTDNRFYYFGHLSQTTVKTGDLVSCTQKIGVEGSTGHSTGPHLHYEVRAAFYKGAKVYNVCDVSGIPNVYGAIYDDGYRPVTAPTSNPVSAKTYNINNKEDVKALQKALNSHGFNCGTVDGIVGNQTTNAMFNALCKLWL